MHADAGRDLLVVVVVAERPDTGRTRRSSAATAACTTACRILLSSCAALTPRMLRLVANIALYFNFSKRSPFSQTPFVYEPRKNSSAIRRSSTPSQVRKLTLSAAHGRQRGDAGADRDEAVERVAQIAGADDLRRIALRRVRRPDVQVVAELRRQEPAGERREELRAAGCPAAAAPVCVLPNASV